MAVANEAVDLSTDYYLWADDPRTVTVTTAEGADKLEYGQVSPRKRSQATPVSGSTVLGELVTWNIPATLISTAGDIAPGDVITEEGGNLDGTDKDWVVEESTLAVFGQQWLCKSVLPAFGDDNGGPGHFVDVIKPSVTRGESSGAAVEDFVIQTRNVPCWVQPALPQLVKRYGALEGSDVSDLVWFQADPLVTTGHVLQFGERILACLGEASNVNGLGRLFVVPCKENQ